MLISYILLGMYLTMISTQNKLIFSSGHKEQMPTFNCCSKLGNILFH